MGIIFREKLQALFKGNKTVRAVRGKGLLNAIVINKGETKLNYSRLALILPII